MFDLEILKSKFKQHVIVLLLLVFNTSVALDKNILLVIMDTNLPYVFH